MLEFFEMNENGAGWVSVDELSIGDEIETLKALESSIIYLACPICLVPVASGQGTSKCEKHR